MVSQSDELFPDGGPSPTAMREEADTSGWRESLAFLRRLAERAHPFRLRFVYAGLLMVGRSACLGMGVFLLGTLLAGLTKPDGDVGWLLVLAGTGVLICQLGAAVLESASDEAQRWALEGVEVSVLQWVVENLIRLDPEYFRTRSVASFVVKLEKLQLVVRVFVSSLLQITSKCIALLGIVAGILPVAPFVGSVALVLLLAVTVRTWLWLQRERAEVKQEHALDVAFAGMISDVFSNAHEYRNFGMIDQVMGRLGESCRTLAARGLNLARVSNGVDVQIQLAGVVGLSLLVAVAVASGATVADALTVFVGMGLMLEPLGQVLRSETALRTRMVKLGDLVQLIDELANQRWKTGGERLTGPIESIHFDGVGFSRRNASIIQDASFALKPGEIVGVLGRSGAGKSTLARLLLRLEDPVGGAIRVNGIDMASLEPAEYWRHAAYVPQVPCAIGRTIAEEIGFALGSASPEQIENVMRAVGIDPALAQLSAEVCEVEEGQGGESWDSRAIRQKIEWARMLLRPASLRILDEPTSMIDPDDEARLLGLLAASRSRHITVIVSHRPSTLSICDRLIALRDGQVVDDGPRDAVLHRWKLESDPPGLRKSA